MLQFSFKGLGANRNTAVNISKMYTIKKNRRLINMLKTSQTPALCQ